jgi:RNA-directed DNA polymerase
MTKASIDLQDLRRRIYVKAKAEPSWRFWGLYVHVCKMETLRTAYEMARQNDGAPGVDGVTFEAIEAQGVEALLEQLRNELTEHTYQPLPARRQEIPKDGGKVRVLSIPAIRLYLNEVDRMLERAREVTRKDKYTHVEYARFADDLVILTG